MFFFYIVSLFDEKHENFFTKSFCKFRRRVKSGKKNESNPAKDAPNCTANPKVQTNLVADLPDLESPAVVERRASDEVGDLQEEEEAKLRDYVVLHEENVQVAQGYHLPPAADLELPVDLEDPDFSLFSRDPFPDVGTASGPWNVDKQDARPSMASQETIVFGENGALWADENVVLSTGDPAPTMAHGSIYSWSLPALDNNDDVYCGFPSLRETPVVESTLSSSAVSCPPARQSCPSCHCDLSCRSKSLESLPVNSSSLLNFAETSLNLENLL